MCACACVHCQFTFSISDASDWGCLACQCDVHRRVVNNAQMCNTHALRTVRMVILDEFVLPWRITSSLTMPRHHPPHINIGIDRCPVQLRARTPTETACHNIMPVFIIPARNAHIGRTIYIYVGRCTTAHIPPALIRCLYNSTTQSQCHVAISHFTAPRIIHIICA
jgi:hypothetical protein